MKLERIFLRTFMLFSFLLLAYGFYIDISNKSGINFIDVLGLVISMSSSILGIIFVVYEVQEHSAMFFISIIASLLMITYLAFWSPLIWDLALSIGYLCISIYGLYYWKKNGKKVKENAIQTQRLTIYGWYLLIAIFSIGIVLLSYIGITIGRYTSSLQAISDACTTVIFIIGQLLLSRKYLESWYMWIVANAISIPLYISIGSYTYAMLYCCYLLISFYGLYSWKRAM